MRITTIVVTFIVAIVTALAVTDSPTPNASAQQAQDPEPTPTPAQTVAPVATPTPEPVVTVREYKRTVRKVYRFSHAGGDFRARPVRRKQRMRLYEMRNDARSLKHRRMMLRYHHRWADQWYWHHRIDGLTPYGKWAIPPYIVACESGGSWSAYNPSGASGPYQLLGWGAPMPANTAARMARHHEIAAGLWAGGRGASHWVCA